MNGAVWRGGVAAVAGVLVLSGSSVAGARAPHDELSVGLDNGSQGRNASRLPGHVAPSRACGERVHPTRRSLAIRVLPDGPRAPDGSLAFTSGVCVYLPPGYARSKVHYPVVYLLHGGGGDAADAITFGHLRAIMDGIGAADHTRAAIVVMPDGDDAQWYDSADRRVQNERYLVHSVVPFVDRHFRTIDTRHGRAIDGVSNGGYGSMLLAAKHPSLFAAAGGMSSNLDGIADAAGHPFAGLGDAGGSYYRANHPVALVQRLANTPIVLDVASRCTSTDPADLCFTQVVDARFLGANRDFVDALRAVHRRRVVVDYRETDGSHQWRWWSRWLQDRQLPFLFSHLAHPTKS